MTEQADSGLSTILLDRLVAFDAASPPLGLYASELQIVRSKWLYPVLKGNGCSIRYLRRGGITCYKKADGQHGEVEVLTVAKIKVREFGDKYVQDSTVTHRHRWDARMMQQKLWDLWGRAARSEEHYLIFIGHDRSTRPFRAELDELRSEVDWGAHGAADACRTWSDPHGRDFHTVAVIWYAPMVR